MSSIPQSEGTVILICLAIAPLMAFVTILVLSLRDAAKRGDVKEPQTIEELRDWRQWR